AFVSYDYKRAKTEVLTAFDDLRHAIDRNYGVLQLQLGSINSLSNHLSPKRRAHLKLQPGFASCIGQRLYPAVIDVTATIEKHGADAFFQGALCHDGADGLRGSDIAAVL